MVDRVYERNASDSAPQPPSDPSTGYPTAGDSSQSVPATVPGPYWFHMITESLRRLVVEAGIAPDHTNHDQVVDALSRLAARTVTTVTAADSPKTLSLAEAGLVLVDASAGAVALTLPSAASNAAVGYRIVRIDSTDANAVTITPDGTDTLGGAASLDLVVGDQRALESDGAGDWKHTMTPFANPTQAGDHLNDTHALTAASLIAGVLGEGSATGSGYATLPYRDAASGELKHLIIQWGIASYTSSTTVQSHSQPLPIAFPNGVLTGFLTRRTQLNASNSPTFDQLIGGTAPGSISIAHVQSSGSNSVQCRYIVIGH